ncbi:MAG: enoyl-CoA hydratase-related protein [Janthinobacterium lividum]
MEALYSAKTHNGVSSLFMHDAARRNALSEDMLNGMIEFFDARSLDTRVIILRANNDQPVWCSGFDIRALTPGFDPLARDGLLQTLFSRIATCPVPVIAMVRGSTWGGGTDLALRCDMVIADKSSQFAFTPARLGLPYDAEGLLNVLLRVGPATALEMFATAEPILAERALATGLINHLIAPEHLERFTDEFAARIVANAPLSVSSAKQHLRALATALSFPASVAQALAESRNRALLSDDYAEGLASFASKRRPVFKGC